MLASRLKCVLNVPTAPNYGPAIARAVEWLGDRYLLARPINAAADRIAGNTGILRAEPAKSSAAGGAPRVGKVAILPIRPR